MLFRKSKSRRPKPASRILTRRRYRTSALETLEDRRLLVIGAFSIPPLVEPGTGFDGVVALDFDNSSTPTILDSQCTGSLLSTGRHILTAAHCVTDETGAINETSVQVVFEMSNQHYVIHVDLTAPGALTVNPAWNGNTADGGDLAIIQLPVIAPFPAERYQIYTDTDELSNVVTLVGYGNTGTGGLGEIAGGIATKRIGFNEIGDIDTLANGDVLRYDFDSGGVLDNTLGDSLGLGNTEAITGTGDSGGPWFMDGFRIAAVTSFGGDDFGAIDQGTRLSGFTGFIDGVLTAAADVVLDMNAQPTGSNGVPDEITARRDPSDVDRLQILIDGQVVWSDLLVRVNSLTLTGSGDDDTFVIDGDFNIDVAVNGGLGFDSLVVRGDGVDDATYTPSATTPGNGAIAIATDTLMFTGLEPITVSALASYTLVTPNSTDVVQVENAGVGQLRVSGTSGGIPFESVTFFDIPTFTIDTATNDGVNPGDIVTLDAPIPATGLTTFNITAGVGTDQVVYRGTEIGDTFHLATTLAASNASGSLLTVNSLTAVEQVSLNGLGGADLFQVEAPQPFALITLAGGNGADSVVFNGTAAAETINLFSNPTDPTRAVLFRNDAGNTVSLDIVDAQRIDINAGGGADRIAIGRANNGDLGIVDAPTSPYSDPTATLRDLSTTSIKAVHVDVGPGDDAADAVFVDGRALNDNLLLSLESSVDPSTVLLAGLPYDVRVLSSTIADRLTVRGNDGNDSIKAVNPTGGGAGSVESVIGITLAGGQGNDTLSADAILIGGIGDDFLEGGAGDDQIFGNQGNDTMLGGDGADTFDGGPGFDTILISGTPGNDVIDVNQTASTTLVHTVNGNTQTDTLAAGTVEAARIEAGEGADLLRANITDALFDDPGLSLRMTIVGGPDGEQDRLGIVDDGTADLTLQRKTQNNDTGSVTIGPGNAEPFEFVYQGVDVVQFVRPVGSRLVVFKHDPNESNDERFTATLLGANATVNVDPTIDPGFDPTFSFAADEDWYRVQAETTGTLDFQALFEEIGTLDSGRPGLPANGNLNIEVYDIDGTLIAGAGPAFGGNDGGGANPELDVDGDAFAEDERIRIPAVQGQTYYLRVFGAPPAGGGSLAINNYSLTIINTPALVPYGLELEDFPVGDPPPANSDTGRSQFDNVTRDDTPTILFRLDDAFFLQDLPGNPAADTPPDEVIPIPFQAGPAQPTAAGYAIAIFDEGPVPPATQLPQVPLGFATMIAPGVYSFTVPAGTPLTNGSHFLSARVQMIDPATPQQTGFGNRSLLLEVVVDTLVPPVVFGDAGNPADGLVDLGGVIQQPATFNDNKINDTTPEFWGVAEANTIIRLFADANGNGTFDAADVQIAQTVTKPIDGTNQALGRWRVESDVNLNDPDLFAGLGIDGVRRIFVTADDLAGNENTVGVGDEQTLDIYLDTQGPQITGMVPNPSVTKPTAPSPPTTAITLNIRDLPNRTAAFQNPAANLIVVVNPGHYRLVGDNVGLVPIQSVTFTPNPIVVGQPATGTIKLNFFEPLPDDRYTLTVSDSIVDDVGNKLDGEDGFITGDGQPGGDFVTRFTIDSRPELGSWAGGSVYLDLNGNFRFDPDNADAANRDVAHTLGYATDYIFAGKFVLTGAVANGYDGLASFGRAGGFSRWQIDTTGDGVPDIVSTEPAGFNPSGQPVAGNFDGNAANGDEIGLFTGTHWIFDTNHNFLLSDEAPRASGIRGLPVVGNFDGVGGEDLAVYSIASNTFILSLSSAGGGIGNPVETTRFRMQFNTPFIGGRERPVAADMNNDGADDLGLWVPDRRGQQIRGTAEWYFIVSADTNGDGVFNVPITARIAGGFIPFRPEPFGDDIFARFGDEFALPVVGNFDPPGVPSSSTSNDPNSTDSTPPVPTAPQVNSGNDFVVLGSDAGTAPSVRLVDRATGEVRIELTPYPTNFLGGVRVATADLNGDGIVDIVTAAGPGGGPHVRVFDGRNGAPLPGVLGGFYAFNSNFTGGVSVATGDVDGDGRDDVIVAAGAGGGPHVRVFNGRDGSLLSEFYAFAPSFTGGVNVAAGNVVGDGRAEIITGAGPGGGPHVRVFDAASGRQISGPGGGFYAYNANFRGGVFVAAGDVDADGRAEIITGAGAGGGSHVRVFRASTGAELAGFFAYDPQFLGGVRVAATNFNNDQQADLVLSGGPGNAQHVRVTDFSGQTELAGYFGFGAAARQGEFVAAPRGAAVALSAPIARVTAAENNAPILHDEVISNWSDSPHDTAIDALIGATVYPSSSAAQQARQRAALLALL